jgi:hypothetical protein
LYDECIELVCGDDELNKLWLLLVVILCVPLVSASLYVTSPFKDSYLLGSNVTVRSVVYNGSGALVSGVGASCTLQLFNGSNYLLLFDNMSMGSSSYVYVFNTSLNTQLGRIDYVVSCNTSSEWGFVNSYFDVTSDGNMKDNGNFGVVLVVILCPLLLGFLLLFASSVLDAEEHSGLKILLWLLSPLTFIVSLNFGVVALIRYNVIPNLVDLISSTVYWFTWIYVALVFYWFIYLIIKAFESARQAKIERLKY